MSPLVILWGPRLLQPFQSLFSESTSYYRPHEWASLSEEGPQKSKGSDGSAPWVRAEVLESASPGFLSHLSALLTFTNALACVPQSARLESRILTGLWAFSG